MNVKIKQSPQKVYGEYWTPYHGSVYRQAVISIDISIQEYMEIQKKFTDHYSAYGRFPDNLRIDLPLESLTTCSM